MSEFNPRDRSRTAGTKADQLRKKHTQPPSDQGGWIAISRAFLESAAYRSLSPNARKALDRLLIEHIGHGRTRNGGLIVPHQHFREYGITRCYVADALDELEYKGFIEMKKGRAGNGTPHATVFRLTFDGTGDGLPATNEWKRCSDVDAARWRAAVRRQKTQRRSTVGRKKNAGTESRTSPVLNPGILRESVGE
ncbi:hypothetical protein OIU34_00450 [Pararhizobium sp. BT-229]|uniref:hypothetical protein n=1 Tax=Pararhizobium sp. BT-229 TaxID=2986923 RepID=UPI0021F76FD0|nr:hypothetical protein [Pararhizobium sp. BT-229]MCV9960355.1 hypothetical protein [Pararhizobium sp. BT-229]